MGRLLVGCLLGFCLSYYFYIYFLVIRSRPHSHLRHIFSIIITFIYFIRIILSKFPISDLFPKNIIFYNNSLLLITMFKPNSLLLECRNPIINCKRIETLFFFSFFVICTAVPLLPPILHCLPFLLPEIHRFSWQKQEN